MADYTDLAIRYEAGASDALLMFDAGKQTIKLEVVPVPTDILLTTPEQLTAALATPGRYRLTAGVYPVNLVAKVAGVTIVAEADAVLSAKEPSLPVLKVLASAFSWQGGAFNAGFNEGVIVGEYTATTAEAQPTDVHFADLTVNADPVRGGSRGFALHCRAITIERCKVLNYFRKGQEVQGIWVCNGPGPYTILDSYIEGAGENFLTGGASFAIPGCVPSDITIRGCTFYKPDRWRTDGSTVKNLFELKSADRVLVENCVFDGNWKNAQAGHAIVFTVRNTAATSGGAGNPWVKVDHIVFRHNVVRRSTDGYAFNILGHDDGGRASEQTTNITIEDNLLEDAPGVLQINNGVTEMLRLQRNTFPAPKGTIIMFANFGIKTHLEVTENCGLTGIYGVFASGGHGPGTAALIDGCGTDNYVFTQNVLERSTYINSAGKPAIANPPLPSGNTLLAPKGITWGPNYTYDADGDGTVDAGWSGTTGLPSGVEVDVQSVQPAIDQAAVDRAITEALEDRRDERVKDKA